MKKGLVLLSVVVLFGVSGCNFFGGKKEETKETKEVAENDMMTSAGQEQAMHDADAKGTLVAMEQQAEGAEEHGMGHDEHDMQGESHEGHEHDMTGAGAAEEPHAGTPEEHGMEHGAEGQPSMPQEQEPK